MRDRRGGGGRRGGDERGGRRAPQHPGRARRRGRVGMERERAMGAEREEGRIWKEKQEPQHIFGFPDSDEKREKRRIRGRSQPEARESVVGENPLQGI